MRYSLKVVLEDDGEKVANVDGRDIRKWESAHDATFIGIGLSYSILTELAFYALKRQGDTDLNWQDFDAACVGVEEAGEVAAARPTKRARGGGRRSS